jgi:predicted phage terminase large subunit-like protein
MKATTVTIKQILKIELFRRKFWNFCLHYDPEFFEQRPFLKEIADAFQEIADGSINSLSVSLPPRAGKSYITSLFCAWIIGKFPKESVMRNTCTATLYQKFSYDVRGIFKSEKYKEIFNARLSKDKSNLNGWNTDTAKMVSYFGAGVGGTIIGFGASKIAVTDDLYRGLEDALSDTINDRVKQWKEATHDSRFETGCARIDIGTRWTRNDVIGSNMESGEYDKSVVVAALDDNDETFCPYVMTTAEYVKKRSKTPNEIWLAEYQQQPIDLKGRLFGEINRISPDEYKRIITIDPLDQANKGRADLVDGYIAYVDVSDQGADYTAAAIAAIVGNRVYIVDYVFTRANTDVAIPLIAAMLTKYEVSYCRVESNSMGAMFARTLQKQTKTRILQVHNTVNKMTRIIMQSAFILNNWSFVELDNPNSTHFLTNVETFSKEGKNKNDDAPDTLAGLSMFIQSMFKTVDW